MIQDLKDLEKVIKLCRRTGVNKITIEGITLELGYEPLITSNKKSQVKSITNETGQIDETTNIVIDKIDTDSLTEEQMLFYSAIPHDVGNQ